MEETRLLAIIAENEIDASEGHALAAKFAEFTEKMDGIEAEAKAIVITDVSQVEEMKKARELRLKLKEMRVGSEKVRKALKEDSLRRGKVIDAIAKIVSSTIEPLEEYLELQEKFAENLERQRVEKINAERLAKLSQFADPSMYNYMDISDEVFASLVGTLEEAHKAKVEAERKAEADRIEAERLAKEEAERNRIELERLKKENDERLAREAEEKRLREEEEAKAQAERDRIEKERLAKEQAEKAEADRKIAEANAEAEAARKALADKEEAERKAEADRVAAEKAEQDRKDEAERQAKLAPEKDKLIAFAERIKSLETPTDVSVAALAIVKDAEEKLLKISQEVREAVKSL